MSMIKVEPTPGESRKDYMLRVASEYIRHNCPDGEIWYDDAICDGYCISDDCEAALVEG